MATWDYIQSNFNMPSISIPSMRYREEALQSEPTSVPVSPPTVPTATANMAASADIGPTTPPNTSQFLSGRVYRGSEPYMDTINATASEYGLDPQLLLNMLHTESNFDPNAYNSSSGASGIAQFIPSTAKQYGVDVADPNSSIRGMGQYMRDLLNMFDGNRDLAVMAYNWGPGNVRSGREAPTETRNYLARVTGSL